MWGGTRNGWRSLGYINAARWEGEKEEDILGGAGVAVMALPLEIERGRGRGDMLSLAGSDPSGCAACQQNKGPDGGE